ncbi:MAG: DUF6320 domain-containing protein [Oscillospiraceae bacterium]
MKHCERCNVDVDSPVSRCPLCYTMLSPADNKPEVPTYPDLSEQAEKYNLVFRILVFLSLAISVTCLTINIATNTDFMWSLLVVINILYMWVAIGTAIRKRNTIGFNIMVQVVSLAALVVFLGNFLDFSRAVFNYILPALFLCATLSISIITIVRRMNAQQFILYFILVGLLGFIPLVLMLLGFTTVRWPSLISAVYSGLSLVSLFIFADNATKMELRKRFHL